MRLRPLGALLLTVVLGAAACGGDNSGSSSTTAAPATTGGGTATTTATSAGGGGATTTAAGGETDLNATFRFGDTVPIVTLDPVRATGAGYNVWLFPVYDRLVQLTPAGEPAPGLATEWTFSADGLTLDMTLRTGVTFHDGTPFNAAAVVANIKRGQTDEKSAVKGDLSIFTDVVAVDDSHVRFTLNAPNASAPLVLEERGGAMASPAAFATLDLKPVGTGMYKVTAFEPSTSATYERNADYWDPSAAAAGKMVFTTITDSLQRANALATGQIDATLLDAPQVADVKGKGFTVDSAASYQFFHLQLNRARSSFGDVRVRQALNHAIDRQALVDGLLFGLGTPTVQDFPEGAVGYSDEVADLYPYDPDKAKQLLQEAGASNLSFETMTLNIPAYVKIAEAIQAQLKEVGVTMNITQVTNVSQSFYVEAAGDSTVINWTGRPDPGVTVQQLYTETGFSNPGKQTTPEVADLQKRELAETDEAARTDLLTELGAQITRDALDVPLYFPDNNLAYADNVVGFQNWVSGKLEFRGTGIKA